MRYLITFSYDGTNYNGYQKQKNKRTIQQTIEQALTKINSNNKVIIYASGRTDAKVHALNQAAHFDLEKDYNLKEIKEKLNKMLPNDIYINHIEEVDNNFHARFNVEKKKYVYKINVLEYNLFDRNYVYQYNKNLNISKMKEASKYFIGKHDFKSFTKATKEITNYTRTIYDINIKQENGIIYLEFIGDGFLRYMVRNIVGTLIFVGEEKINPKDIVDIINKKDRKEAFITAPAEGLYLDTVYYKKK